MRRQRPEGRVGSGAPEAPARLADEQGGGAVRGAPSYDASNAAALTALGIPAFACTPDAFPDLLALAINGGDIAAWTEREQLASR